MRKSSWELRAVLFAVLSTVVLLILSLIGLSNLIYLAGYVWALLFCLSQNIKISYAPILGTAILVGICICLFGIFLSFERHPFSLVVFIMLAHIILLICAWMAFYLNDIGSFVLALFFGSLLSWMLILSFDGKSGQGPGMVFGFGLVLMYQVNVSYFLSRAINKRYGDNRQDV